MDAENKGPAAAGAGVSEPTVIETGGRLAAPRLGRREMELLIHLCDGLSMKETADEMGLTHATVKRYAHFLYGKLGVGTCHAAVAMAFRTGLVGYNGTPAVEPIDRPRTVVEALLRKRDALLLRAFRIDCQILATKLASKEWVSAIYGTRQTSLVRPGE